MAVLELWSRLEEPLCLLQTPCADVYPAGNEEGRAGDMKGAGTGVKRLTAALSELRCVKFSKSFAVPAGCGDLPGLASGGSDVIQL